MDKKPPWYTVGFDEIRFLERSGPTSTDFQRRWLADKSSKWNWQQYRRQAGITGQVSDTAFEYSAVVNVLTKAQASRVIEAIKDSAEPISLIDLFSPKK